MKKIDDQIAWYDKNATRKEDDFIKAQLKLINHLYAEIEDADDAMFMDEIIGTFCKVIEIQRDVISELIMEAEQSAYTLPTITSYVPNPPAQIDDFTLDKTLQETFVYRLTYQSDKKLSSYTINDYCSRVKNLWGSFYDEYLKSEEMQQNYCIQTELVQPDQPMVNAYNHTLELFTYIQEQLVVAKDRRNWANANAALNKFCEVMQIPGFCKSTSNRNGSTRDRSTYIFNNEEYSKSRLVLAVISKCVADHPDLSFMNLQHLFPDELQGSKGVVKLLSTISHKDKGIGGVKRYFVNNDEILTLASGEEVVVCTQWGINNIDNFINHAFNILGYSITKA